jgi:uncharacterized protein YdeI (YjbR/CyaY-like superfamily)
MNTKVDDYIDRADKWADEMRKLRAILLDCLLTEEFKWGVPCYTYGSKNIILITAFKEYCGIAFFKGSLLSDEKKILYQQTENSQASRLIRFTNLPEIVEMEALLKTYIFEAIEIEKSGLKVERKKHEDYVLPDELIQKFGEMPTLKTAFEALTPGRQRGYLLHFAGSNNSATRMGRIEKYIGRILKGQGITDCVCGLSKKMPGCDGSHKFINQPR